MSDISTGTTPRPETPWQVRLTAFKGPLDVLLHLIRIEEIKVAEIPVLEVARQYDEYLSLWRDPNLDSAGDYLVMTATLAHMKSRSLLPPDPAEATARDEGPSPLERLLPAAQGIRRATEHLQEREAVMELVFSRPADRVADYVGEQGIEADLSALLRAFQEILRRLGDDPASRLTRERMTLVERINWLLETVTRERRIGFRSLFSGLADRVSCILTFLALLELIRLRLVRAFASHHQEDLVVTLAEETSVTDRDGDGERSNA
ncbi:MAG TPA: segregation/condensation protein A [Candidatus Polarisedimenticolia bacterium]|nr:segregation/condensation protein A [Candidatus Polarisedimenticolia bacterium]